MVFPEFKVWIVLFLSAQSFQLAFSDCASDWISVNVGSGVPTKCYKIFSHLSYSYDQAGTYCKNLGGYLFTDQSANVHQALLPNVIAATVTSYSYTFWMGLSDNNTNNGPWVWADGTIIGSYTHFRNFIPTNTRNARDCFYVSENNNDFKWVRTTACTTGRAFICQKSSNPTVVTSTTPRPLNCPTGWSAFQPQNTCIKLFTNQVSWTVARNQCPKPYSDLVRINNTALNTFVSSLIAASNGIYWIGLNSRVKNGTFVWLDDTTPANYTHWNPGNPNNLFGNENCVTANGFRNSQWEDADCSLFYRFICQTLPFGGLPPFRTPGPTQTHVNCGYGWEDVAGADTCLMFNTNVLSWLDAENDCNSHGGHLASIYNQQEQSYISARALSFPAANSFWIGANDRYMESGYQWSDGSPLAYLNWDVRQPDNAHNSDCVVISQKNGRWDDVPCDSRNGYICKKRGTLTSPSLVTTTTPPAHLPADKIFGCPRGWDNFRGSCYKAMQVAVGVTWAAASASCSSSTMQSSLVAITDSDENQFVYALLPMGYFGYAWIGLEDPVENTFNWVDGTPVQYTNWNYGEPNNDNNEDCVAMISFHGTWGDVQCTNTYTVYVCKKNKSIQPKVGSPEEQGCSNTSIGYGAQCYSFITQKKNFNDAQRDCRARSQNLGNLATVDTGHLQAFLSAELYAYASIAFWIGLQQSNDVYKWQSNWPVDFTYWGSNHTGNERSTCVAMQQSGLWANYACNQVTMGYICESPRSGFTTATTRAVVTRQLPCPTGWAGYGNLCYKAFSMNISDMNDWGDARDFCARQAAGGSLVTINNNATQAWLYSNIILAGNITSGTYWIGLNDRESESGYVWLDQSPYLYSNWAPGEPNDQLNREDCVEWVLPDNNWNDNYCYISTDWICQVPRGSRITTPKPLQTGAQSAACGNASWTQFSNDACYFVSSDGGASSATWFDARDICKNLGSDLASIGGDDENGFITSLITKKSNWEFWIGLNDLDLDTFGWTDMNPVTYVNWAQGEPNDNYGEERCVEITSAGSWNDKQCQANLGFICKKYPRVRPTYYTPTPAVGGCPRDFVSIPALSYCYHVGGNSNSTRKNYDDAMTACDQMVHKSTLASIHSSLEEKFLIVLMANLRTPAWIGLNDRQSSNQFQWVDNLAVTYTNWGPGQPDENMNDPRPQARRDCVDVEIRRNMGSWNDRSCSTAMAYICQSRKSPTLPTVAPNDTGCHAGYQRFRNSCYRLYTDYYNFTIAEKMCQLDAANLVTISSGIEQAFAEILTGHSNDSYTFWLGLQYDRVNDAFNWVDAWPVRFTNWGHNEPNVAGGENCVTHTVDGQWQMANCSERHHYICEANLGSPPPTRTYNVGRCPSRAWRVFSGNCYLLQTQSPKAWAAANAACSYMGASLGSIHSDQEAHFLTNLIGQTGKDFWIGLYKGQGDGFSWYDNTEVEYLNWASGEPNDPDSYLHQDCVKMRNQDGQWADTDCLDVNAYICKTAQVYPTGQTQANTGNIYPTGQTQANTGNSSHLSGGAVAGIVVGTFTLVALVAVISFLMVRYRRGQLQVPFAKTPLTTPEPGFDNASYSGGQDTSVNFSDA